MASLARISFLTGVGLLVPGLALAQSSTPSSASEAPAAETAGTSNAPTPTPTPTSSASPSPSTEHEATVNPSSIGASEAPVPAATSGERAAAHASEPAYAHANHPHEEDNGRSVDFLFIQAEGGLSVIDLTGLSSSSTGASVAPSLHEMRQSGYGGGLTVGFRSWIFAVAAHGYISRFISGAPSTVMGVMNNQDFDFGQVMLEGQIRIPLPVVEPYVRVGFGYAFLGAFQLNQMYEASTSEINGWTGKVGAGLDVWLGHYITVGAGADFSVMNLRRGGVMRDSSTCPTTDPTCVELRMDGDSLGWLIAAHIQAGLHF